MAENTLKINNLKNAGEVVITIECTKIFNLRLALARFFIKLASISAGFGIKIKEV
jgi:hypothetical protein